MSKKVVKLTEAQLRRIIKEESGNLVGETRPEKVSLKPDAWEGGENLDEPLDLAKILFGLDTLDATEDKAPVVKENCDGTGGCGCATCDAAPVEEMGWLSPPSPPCQNTYDTVLGELNMDPLNTGKLVTPLMDSTGTSCPLSAAMALVSAILNSKNQGYF
jgi:hypothetical protein